MVVLLLVEFVLVLDELDLDFLKDVASRFMVTMMLRWCCWLLRLFYDVVGSCWLLRDD